MRQVDITDLLPLEERESRSVEDAGLAAFIVQFDGELHAFVNRCPHLGVELNWLPDQFLESGGDLIICSTHGALFRIDNGLCITGPCQGDHLTRLPIIRDEGRYFIVVEV